MTELATQAKQTLKGFIDEINPVIDAYFEKKLKYTEKMFPPHSVKAVEVYQDVTMRGGKRLRSSFVYMAYQMYGGKDLKTALKVGVAIELTHAYLLLLDDFMDLSDTRRHGPTAHVVFTDYFKENDFKGDAKHFGDSLAVTTGAMGFHMAMQIVNNLDVDPEIRIILSRSLNDKMKTTHLGQIADIVNTVSENVTEDDVMDMLRWKTGVYTYENPIHTGAILAGISDKSELGKLSDYAIPAGIAFQIQDDILGMFGDPSQLGKAVTDDLAEGKYTLLIHKALELGTNEQKKVLRKHMSNREIRVVELKEAQDIIVETGSLDYSRKKALDLVQQALDSLEKNDSGQWNKKGLNYLKGIAMYMIEREV